MIPHTVIRQIVRSVVFLGVIGFGFPGRLAAQNDWAPKMFDEQRHDFGTVATGAECWHRIKVTNPYKDDVQIAGVRTSCTCAMTKPPEKNRLASHESTFIEVGMDTQRFYRQKDSNLIVSLNTINPMNQPLFAEVTIPVSVYIRTDIVLNPGSVNFGPVDEGAGAEKKVEIAYAGREDWKINQVVTNNQHLTAKFVETARGGGRVLYDLLVALKPTAPAGNLRQPIYLVTNDANAPQVPVQVQARIEPDITVVPSTQLLGTMEPGTEKTVNFMIRGRAPFVIEKIEVDSDRKASKVTIPKDAKLYHTLPITITAPQDARPFTEQFTVTIAGRPQPVTFIAKGNVAVRAAATGN